MYAARAPVNRELCKKLLNTAEFRFRSFSDEYLCCVVLCVCVWCVRAHWWAAMRLGLDIHELLATPNAPGEQVALAGPQQGTSHTVHRRGGKKHWRDDMNEGANENDVGAAADEDGSPRTEPVNQAWHHKQACGKGCVEKR